MCRTAYSILGYFGAAVNKYLSSEFIWNPLTCPKPFKGILFDQDCTSERIPAPSIFPPETFLIHISESHLFFSKHPIYQTLVWQSAEWKCASAQETTLTWLQEALRRCLNFIYKSFVLGNKSAQRSAQPSPLYLLAVRSELSSNLTSVLLLMSCDGW